MPTEIWEYRYSNVRCEGTICCKTHVFRDEPPEVLRVLVGQGYIISFYKSARDILGTRADTRREGLAIMNASPLPIGAEITAQIANHTIKYALYETPDKQTIIDAIERNSQLAKQRGEPFRSDLLEATQVLTTLI